MLNLKNFFNILDETMPIELSYKMIEKGDYDNSGILVSCNDCVNNVLFTLDLSVDAVKKAKRLKCDTIVTHHPAIYSPLKSLDKDDTLSSAVVLAIKNNINVISMHLNLDVAKNGIDHQLCLALGGSEYKILNYVDETHGYGREFKIPSLKLYQFVNLAKKKLNTNKIQYYGNKNSLLNYGASYCGSGAEIALKNVKNNETKADVIITADMPHHHLKELIENGKNIILLTHYASENFGFKVNYENIKNRLTNIVNVFYFEDKRFM